MSEGTGTFARGKLESAQQALDELRKQFFGICNRLERAGLNAGMIVMIGELYEAAEKERLRKAFDGSTGGSDRVRDAILSGGSDPAPPVTTAAGPFNFARSSAATRARIEEGISGI